MIEQVRPDDLDAWRLRRPAGSSGDASALPAPLVLLDVREPWELQTARVTPPEGMELVAIPMNEIPGRLRELDPARPVACLCHHGARSQRVAAFLVQNGFDDVANIAGGIDAWSATRDPAVPRY
jgi:rhodanese-related sulfurtransferase